MASQLGKPVELKIKAVDAIKKGQPISRVSIDAGVSIRTLQIWLKWYREGGIENLKRVRHYHRALNRTPEKIEEKVYLLKEQKPPITLSQAQMALYDDGIQISQPGIRKIWQRYGLIGFEKERIADNFTQGIPPNSEVDTGVKKAMYILEQDSDIKEAARILNSLPYCSNFEILERIPDRYLGLRRKVEKIGFLFGKEPIRRIYHRAKNLRESCEEHHLNYSSLRVGYVEAVALSYMGKNTKVLELITSLEPKLPGTTDPALRFDFYILKGYTYAQMMNLQKAEDCAQRCQILIKTIPLPTFQHSLSVLYSSLQRYSRGRIWLEKAAKVLSNTNKEIRDSISLGLGIYMSLNGEYRNALKTLKKVKAGSVSTDSLMLMIRAYSNLGLGRINDAVHYAETAIERVKKNILGDLHAATLFLACTYNTLGEKKKAQRFLNTLTPLLKNSKQLTHYYIRLLLAGNVSVPEDVKKYPMIRLILFLQHAQHTKRVKCYYQALKLAKKNGITGFFHRMCLFFPDVVSNIIEKGKSTEIPRAFLRLPVFNKRVFSFRINFLGQSIKIYQKENLLKTKLYPKETTFLIHLVLSKEHRLSCNEVYQNFWPKTRDPHSSLRHLLWLIRRALGIASHYLYIRNGHVWFKGFFTTDYQDFKRTLTIAKSLEKLGKWGFAKKEYLRAFALFRGEPFKKMYDPWSEHMRRVILNGLETEAIHFAESCFEHNNKIDAKGVLEKILKIIPNSEEIREMVRECESDRVSEKRE